MFKVFELLRHQSGTPEREKLEKELHVARVEHVAKSLWEAVNMMDDPFAIPWESICDEERDAWREDARRFLREYLR